MMNKIQTLFVQQFGSDLAPKIVFWNLRASASGSGVVKDEMEDAVALLSGFSSEKEMHDKNVRAGTKKGKCIIVTYDD